MNVASSARGWLILVLGSSFCLMGQIAQFEVKEDKILIRMSSGETREAPAAGVDRKFIRVSPDRMKLVYHPVFAGYPPNTDLRVRVWSSARPEKVDEFRVPTLSRHTDSVEWIDNRLVLFAGDGTG